MERLWRQAKIKVLRKRPRRRVVSTRPRPKAPSMINQVWAIDLVHDACANGRKINCQMVAEEFTREGLAIEVAGAIRLRDVIDVLS